MRDAAINKRKSRPGTEIFEQQETIVVVCRGGDCGSRRKHPGVDYAGQLRLLRRDLAGKALVATSKGLDACEHSNVVVVVPGVKARPTDPAPIWFGGVNDPDTLEGLSQSVSEDKLIPRPSSVAADVARFTPTRLSRNELKGGTVVLPSASRARGPHSYRP